MLVKREAPEDVWGADLQHLDDTAKAGLLESQSPAVESAHPSVARLHTDAVESCEFLLSITASPARQAMRNELIQGDERGA